MIVTAQSVSNAGIGIIDRIAKEESRTAISPPHNKVAQLTGGYGTRTVHQIVKLQHLPRRHGKAQCRRFACGQSRCALRRVQVPAGAGIARRLTGRQLRPALRL